MDEVTKLNFGEPIRVLLVEDNPVDLKVLERMLLESSLYPPEMVKTTTSFKETIKLLKKEKVDVIVLDLNLPDCQGLETLIQLNQQYPSMAIVVNTGAYEDDVGLKTLGLGAQDFIIKGKYQAYGLNKAIQYAKERKKFELELLNAYKNLQETQSQLIQAEKMNTVGRLASGIAHEVKNPLATILFGIGFLHEKLKDPDENIALTLKSIKDSAQRANDIITDLLDFSSLSKLNTRLEDVNTIIEKSLELTHHPLDKNVIKVVKELMPALPKLEIDCNRIEQVFVNLILNAIHAMPKGGILKIRSYGVSNNQAHKAKNRNSDLRKEIEAVCIEIEDTGVGIAEDKLPHIFEPFYTTRRAQGGVGLGLSVAKNIIDMHKGQIEIKNRTQGGVCARVVLKIGIKGG